MPTTKLSQKYQIVIPKDVRTRLQLRSGMRVYIEPLDGTHAILSKQPKDYIKAYRGLGKEMWRSLGGADKYIKQERASWGKR